jgi:DNA-binding transcriptional regulator YiaG
MAELVGGPYELAVALHASHATLWRWAHGKSHPRGTTRAFIADWCKRRGLKSPVGVP